MTATTTNSSQIELELARKLQRENIVTRYAFDLSNPLVNRLMINLIQVYLYCEPDKNTK